MPEISKSIFKYLTLILNLYFFAVTWKKSFELFQYQNSLHAYMYMDDKFHENNTKYLYNEFEAWFFWLAQKI